MDQTFLDGLAQDALTVQTTTIVIDADDDSTTRMRSGKTNGTERRLAGSHPLCGRLQAVVNGIANHVDERVCPSS